jgi:hypothetical protein
MRASSNGQDSVFPTRKYRFESGCSLHAPVAQRKGHRFLSGSTQVRILPGARPHPVPREGGEARRSAEETTGVSSKGRMSVSNSDDGGSNPSAPANPAVGGGVAL